MAFNINAHVILSGPKGIRAVRKKIQSQLGSVRIPIKLDNTKGLTRNINQINKSIRTLRNDVNKLSTSATKANTSLGALSGKFRTLNASSAAMSKSQASSAKQLGNTASQVGKAGNAISKFGKDAALALRRFAAFTVATTAVFGFVRAVGQAVKAGLQYDQTMVKIIQVTGAASNQIESLNRTIDNLSNSLGVDANELANIARTFAQTGQTIAQVEASMKAVARASLAPTFGSMKDTAEGLIAATAQFNIAAQDQEKVLGALNAVSKKFAVESEDLISVIRRAGGVFAASGRGFETPIEGLNQLIGVFTAVRSTTRESADTIAVGLRTIFTRIQRRGTIDFLKQFNIELVNAQGNFIGLFPAFQALAKGLDGIVQRGDALTLSAITEELGGVRQVGKLIPAITQFNKALDATQVAAKGAAQGLDQDVRLALQPLAKQFELVQRRFETLIRTITETPTFDIMARSALALANALLRLGETLAPLIPILTALAAIKIGKGVMAFAAGFTGKVASAGGAKAVGGNLGSFISGGGRGFASGGLAKGTDTVPAMLTPGEFVIKRSSAQKIGYGNLSRMNRYAQGGVVKPQYLANGSVVQGAFGPAGYNRPSLMSMVQTPSKSSGTTVTASMKNLQTTVSKTSGQFTKLLSSVKTVGKAFGGFGSLIAGAVAEAGLSEIGERVIGEGFFGMGGMGFGAKQTIAGTDISGRAGVSTVRRGTGGRSSEADVVATFESIGPAVGSAIAAGAITAMIPGMAPFAPAVAVAVGALELFKGQVVGFAKQVEFNAFDKMRKSMDGSVEVLNRFNALGSITDRALANLTHQVEDTSDRFGEVKQAAIARAQAENKFTAAGFFGREGVISSFVGGGAAGTAVSAGAAGIAGAGAGAAIGAGIGAIVPVAIPVTAAIGALVGGIGSFAGALMTTNQNVKTTAQGFDRAAQSITPQFIEGLNKAIDKTTNELFSGMDEGVLKEISKTQTIDPNLNLANQAELTNRAFGKIDNALGSTNKTTQENIARLKELNAISIKTGLVKAVEEEAKLLGDAAPDFKAAFSGIQQNLNGAIDGFFRGEKSLNDVMALIDADSKMTGASKEALKKYIMGKVEEINTNNKNAATLSLINKAAAKTRSSIDALAAGLESFSSTTSDIANRSTILAGQIKNEFGQIFGEKSIGQLTNINPFDNIENATDREIDQGMAQFGPGASDLGAFVKSTRNLDEMFKGVVDELQNRGGDIANVDVQNAIRSRLGATGAPVQVVEDILSELSANIGNRQGEGKALTIDVLKDLLQGEGGVQSQFAESVQNITNEFKEATDDLNKFRNSILEAAQLSTELAKKRLDTELAIAEKQKNIQERVDKALGKAPKSLARVTGDLSKKVRTLAGGGTGIPVGGNVLDPRTLFNRLGGLEDRRKQLRDRLGLKPGEELKASATRTPEFMQAAQELAQLNAQINGTEKALEELANDTTRLAKLESLMADAKAKELASTGSIVSLLDAISAVRTGKMDRKTFQQQVAAPMQAVEDVFAGQAIGFDAAVDLIGRIRSGDQLIGGQLQRKASEQAMLTGRQGEEAQIIEEILQSLLQAAGQTVMQNDTSGFGEFLGRQFQFSGQQRGRAQLAGSAMIGVGDRQSQILAQTMARRDAQFREEVLRPAQEGFMNAAMTFDQAVEKFVRMRGGRGLASGGVVTMAAGGNVFKPKGTDTVPAMLTPGEFVINASSAKKIGYGNLAELNNFSQGGLVGNTQYLFSGGKSKKKRKQSWKESKGRYKKTGSGVEFLRRYGITLRREPGGQWRPVSRVDASQWMLYQRDPERYRQNWRSDQATMEKRRKERDERARREKARQRSLNTRGPVINPLGDRELGYGQGYGHLFMSKGGIVPRYQTGTDLVSRSGLAYLHRGEQVRPARSANGLSRTTTTQGDGNIFNEMQKGSALLTTELTSAFSVGASKMQPLVQALNSIPHEITLRAQLGAVTVNLAGGQILESLKNGIVAQMRKEIAEAIRSAINPVTGETVAPSISPFMGGPGEG